MEGERTRGWQLRQPTHTVGIRGGYSPPYLPNAPFAVSASPVGYADRRMRRRRGDLDPPGITGTTNADI